MSPESLEASPGEEIELGVDVYNSTQIIDGFDLAVVGLDQRFVTYEPHDLSLFPGTEEHVDVGVTIPATHAAGDHNLAIRVISKTDGEVYTYREIPLRVKGDPKPSIVVDPESVTGGRKGRFAVTVRNDGAAPLDVRLEADDAENHLQYDFTDERIRIEPGRRQSVRLTAQGGRAFTGTPASRVVSISAVGTDPPLQKDVVFIQKPWVPRFVVTIALIASLLGLWAIVVGAAIDKILDDTDTDLAAAISEGVDNVLDDLAPTAEAAGGSATDIGGSPGAVPEGEGGVVRGRVFLYSDNESTPLQDRIPIPGAQVSAIAITEDDKIDATRDPLVGETNDAGSFKVADLGVGRYWLKVSAPGYTTVWVADKSQGGRADDVLHPTLYEEISETTDIDVLDIPWSGTRRYVQLVPVSGSVSGSVSLGEQTEVAEDDADGVPEVDNSGVAVAIKLVDETGLGVDDAVMFTTVTGASGTFELPCLPKAVATGDVRCSPSTDALDPEADPAPLPLQPGTYLLTFAKDGFAAQQVTVVVEPGTALEGLDIALVKPDSTLGTQSFLVKGTVTGNGGLAGVEISVSGPATIDTATDDKGVFEFSVPLPGTYNITFSKDGYDTFATTFEVGEGTDPPDLKITLVAEPVAASGTLLDSLGNAIENASVWAIASGDPDDCTTASDPGTAETGPGGAFTVTGLEPGLNVICFAKAGFATSGISVVATPGVPVSGVSAVLNELVGLSGQVFVEAPPSQLAWDLVSLGASKTRAPCMVDGNSSYQSFVPSGSRLVTLTIPVWIEVAEGAEVADEIQSTLRIWDPNGPTLVGTAQRNVPTARSDGYYVHVFPTPGIALVPGMTYLLEWNVADGGGVEAKWVRSGPDDDAHPAGMSTVCAEPNAPPVDLESDRDFFFVGVGGVRAELAGATISVEDGDTAISDIDGVWTAQGPVGARLVEASRSGYETVSVQRDLLPDVPTSISFTLRGKPGSLAGSINCRGCQPTVVTIDGTEVPLDAAGRFSVSVPATPAAVQILWEANDSTFGRLVLVGGGETKDVGELARDYARINSAQSPL